MWYYQMSMALGCDHYYPIPFPHWRKMSIPTQYFQTFFFSTVHLFFSFFLFVHLSFSFLFPSSQASCQVQSYTLAFLSLFERARTHGPPECLSSREHCRGQHQTSFQILLRRLLRSAF